MSITIAIDAMGGDHGLPVTVPAALKALAKHPELQLILVGQPEPISQALKSQGITTLPPRLLIEPATQLVDMDELPSVALRTKKDSSMRVAIDLVKAERAQACVSAGNTGALMATSRFVLKTIPGVERPAIITAFPAIKPHTIVRVLDLGANVDSTPEHLLQFAVMGSIAASALSGIARPTVGLLNIGQEEIKGNEQVKEAAQLLASHSELNYIGYAEGNDMFSGAVDVIVCDGFVGNVALKSSEGAIRCVLYYLKQAFYGSWYGKLMGFLAKPVFKTLKRNIDPGNYNGACLIGLRGIVIKSHGSADINAFANAISEALLQAKQNIPQLVHTRIEQWLQPSFKDE